MSPVITYEGWLYRERGVVILSRGGMVVVKQNGVKLAEYQEDRFESVRGALVRAIRAKNDPRIAETYLPFEAPSDAGVKRLLTEEDQRLICQLVGKTSDAENMVNRFKNAVKNNLGTYILYGLAHMIVVKARMLDAFEVNVDWNLKAKTAVAYDWEADDFPDALKEVEPTLEPFLLKKNYMKKEIEGEVFFFRNTIKTVLEHLELTPLIDPVVDFSAEPCKHDQPVVENVPNNDAPVADSKTGLDFIRLKFNAAQQSNTKDDPNFYYGGDKGKVIFDGLSKTKLKGLGGLMKAGPIADSLAFFVRGFLDRFTLEDSPINILLAERRFMAQNGAWVLRADGNLAQRK